MSQLKKAAILKGDVLQDVATGQLFKLHPTKEEIQRGIWEYNSEADGVRWHYVVLEGITYAINECYVDWDQEVEVWSPNEMGQWPFGNRLSEEELFLRELDDVLFLLECYLEAELEWMDRIGDEENAESDDDEDSDDDYNSTSEDEGYSTSPEVDFDKYDYWALSLNSFLWTISLYKGSEDGFWTL